MKKKDLQRIGVILIMVFFALMSILPFITPDPQLNSVQSTTSIPNSLPIEAPITTESTTIPITSGGN